MDKYMIKNPSYAREIVAMRNQIQNGLTPEQLIAINWQALANVAVAALDRGWTGDEMARWALGDLSERTDSIGASMHTTLTRLGQTDPPREHTPTPDPFDRGELAARRAQRAADPSAWAARIRAGDRTPA